MARLDVDIHIDSTTFDTGAGTWSVWVELDKDEGAATTLWFEKGNAVEQIDALIAALQEAKGRARERSHR
jgi:hypothetical protein